MKLKLKRRQIEGRRVIEWSIWHKKRKRVAGGMCANMRDARNDGKIWMRRHCPDCTQPLVDGVCEYQRCIRNPCP